MKRIPILLVALAAVLGLSVAAHADLILRGTDTLGNQLIYDTDFDITWYDYTSPLNTWQNQVAWADALTVKFGDTAYDGWRLPVSDTCTGYNCTGSEMGHLYYTELGNVAGGPLSTSFTDGLTGTTESFLNLQSGYYWSGTEYAQSTGDALLFATSYGYADYDSRDRESYGLALRPGDVSAVPEPGTLLLLGTGLAGLLAFRRRFGR